MNKINDGGPAFANAWTETNEYGVSFPYVTNGLTKREWFAGMALAGYFAAPNTPHRNATDCAEYLFKMADAMLAESQKGGAA